MTSKASSNKKRITWYVIYFVIIPWARYLKYIFLFAWSHRMIPSTNPLIHWYNSKKISVFLIVLHLLFPTETRFLYQKRSCIKTYMTTDREYYRVSSLIKKLLEVLFKSLTNLPNLITRLIPLHSLDKWLGYLSGKKILLLPLGNIIVIHTQKCHMVQQQKQIYVLVKTFQEVVKGDALRKMF